MLSTTTGLEAMTMGKQMACWCFLSHTYKRWHTYNIGAMWYVQAGPILHETIDDEGGYKRYLGFSIAPAGWPSEWPSSPSPD